MQRYVTTMLLLCFFLVANSQTGYIKFDDIEGEVKTGTYNGWSTINLLEHDMARPMAAGPARARQRVDVKPIRVRKSIDKASPKIAEALTKGQRFGEVTVHLTRSNSRGAQVYMEIQLSGVQIEAYQLMVDGPESAQEEFELNFEKMTVAYTTFGSDGRATGKVEYQYNRVSGR